MTITLLILAALCIWNIVDIMRLEKRVLELEKSLPAKIERARHEGWLDGVLYQSDVEKRRHPRGPDGKFTTYYVDKTAIVANDGTVLTKNNPTQ